MSVIRILVFLAAFSWLAWPLSVEAVFSSLLATPNSAIGGFVFVDGDGDGRFSGPFDRPLAGVEVRLAAPCGGEPRLYRSAMSDEEGYYRFVGVGRGCFSLHALAPDGYVETTSQPHEVRLAWGDEGFRYDLGLARPGHVVGVVFEDANGNGLQDTGEAGLADVLVNLFQDANGNEALDAEDALLATARTEPSEGAFAFQGYLPGRYLLVVTPPQGFTATTPAVQGLLLVTGDAGGDLLYCFGLRRADTPPRAAVATR